MKKLITVFLLASFLKVSSGIAVAQEKELQGSLVLSGAWAIYPTAVAWADVFQKKYPKVKIDVSAGGAGKGAVDAIAGLVDIGMVSREPDPSEIKKGIIPIYILHDAIFAVVNENNPVLPVILKKGLKKQDFVNIYIDGITTNWGQVTGSATSERVHVYTRSDSCGAASSWAGYLGKKQEDLKGIGVYGDPGLLETVKRDRLGLGFNNFSYVFKRDGSLVDGIKLVPIDSNENGVIDKDELYSNREEAVKSIRTGRYPATRKNYFFIKGKPKGLVKEFIEFALSDEGTQIVDSVSASLSLTKPERNNVLKSLD